MDNTAPNSGLYSPTSTVDRTAPKSGLHSPNRTRCQGRFEWRKRLKGAAAATVGKFKQAQVKGRGNAFGSKQRCREARGAVKVGECPGEERRRCAQKPSVPNILARANQNSQDLGIHKDLCYWVSTSQFYVTDRRRQDFQVLSSGRWRQSSRSRVPKSGSPTRIPKIWASVKTCAIDFPRLSSM